MAKNSDKSLAFQDMLKDNLSHYLTEALFKGKKKVRLSRHHALMIFKIALGTPIQFLTEIWDRAGLKAPKSFTDVQTLHRILKVTIARVARFSIYWSKPKTSQGRPAALEGKTKYVPHYKIYPSGKVQDVLLKELTGIDSAQLVEDKPIKRGLKKQKED